MLSSIPLMCLYKQADGIDLTGIMGPLGMFALDNPVGSYGRRLQREANPQGVENGMEWGRGGGK